MKITFWSDFNCPNSYIGLYRLKMAADELNMKVEWKMKPFELYPTLFDTPTGSIITQNTLKYGLTPEIVEQRIIETEEIALNDGLKINYKDIQLTSSRNAHRLVKFIQNKYPEMILQVIFKIFEANFKENRVIADVDVLVDICVSLGLDEKEMKRMLESDSYDFEVQIYEEDAIAMGVESIPLYFLEISQEHLIIPGAYEKESLKIAIEDMINGELESKSFI